MTAEAATPTSETPKRKRRVGRRQARGKDGFFDVVGAELIGRVVHGELGVRGPKRPGWLAKQLGLLDAKSIWRWRRRWARPDLAQALALQALFPWIPVIAWLTPEERQMVLMAQETGKILAAEPPPNPKTSRKKEKADPRQVTLEEVIAAKVPPTKPKPAAPVVIDEPDLGDWDPSFEGAPTSERSLEP
jgi:hypothetical protein